MDNEFSHLWQRHLTALRDDFSTASVEALPSLPSGPRSLDDRVGDAGDEDGHPWDEKISSVVDALDELTLQSPNTTESRSPGTPWFPDREGYTETALSSPENISWPRTVRSSNNPVLSAGGSSDPSTSDFRSKGKGLERKKPPPAPLLLQKQLLQESYTNRHLSGDPVTAATTATATAATVLHSPAFQSNQKGPPSQVHVLILTWAKHDRRGEDGQLLSPGLDNDTEAVRACFKRQGYRVQCRLIPADYPTAAVETMLDRFLEKSEDGGDSLLVIYYHGWGSLDVDGRMVFSRDPDPSTSSFFWDDVRDPVMQSPGDVLLIFDCTALPGAGPEQHEMRIEAGMISSPSTKQLLGVCVPSSLGKSPTALVPSDLMTQSLCRTLDRMGDVPVLSVQRLCSLMREDLRGTDLASRVFVTQLGGGQLLDIYLARIEASPRSRRQSDLYSH
ncbi:hypothetical protein MFIFM68171_06977 [Madurella fahalii]|uniref:Peptidase C14 caspase domain-containing protein n=1 Tax=Madurella fahalii TaxID=1157608 RepID=A0ABQ0GGA4_9PEZI